MEVRYFSRTRKPELESGTLEYAELKTMLSWAEIISIHVPKHTNALDADAFSLIEPGTVLINTSLGPTFEIGDFLRWIEQGGNFAILDGDGVGRFRNECLKYPNIIVSESVGGWTRQARERLTRKVLDNIKSYLSERGSVLDESI
jgi:hypothetical protein